MSLRLIHTADWHLGKRFPSFRERDEATLRMARLEVLDRVFAAADSHDAHAVLCAGDLFDEPMPAEAWWRPLAERLRETPPARPIFLLPGNHDPLMQGSVWQSGHPFRALLPAHAQVVDRADFSAPLGPGATLYANPCTSQAGQEDPALALPSRAPGDEQIRVGMVHGSTFDMTGVQVPFPIAKDAAIRRGLDYLAIGDTHSFKIVPPDAEVPTVYPGTPEPTRFDEERPGTLAVVLINSRRRARVECEEIAYWRWEQLTVRSLDELRALARRTDLRQRVLRLTVDARLSVAELEEARRLLEQLGGMESRLGRVGILDLDTQRLVLDTRGLEDVFASAPEGLREAARRLLAKQGGQEDEVVRRALYRLYVETRKVI